MKPYSKDLRSRVLAAVDCGVPREEEVAKTFSVSVGADHKALAQEAAPGVPRLGLGVRSLTKRRGVGRGEGGGGVSGLPGLEDRPEGPRNGF